MSSAEYYRKYYEEHKEEIQKYKKKYDKEHKEEARKYRAENKERIQENRRRHSEKNPEYQREWWKKNPKKRKEYYQKQANSKDRILYWLIEKYGGTPCMDCGKIFDWCVMDFDHRPGEVKDFGIASFGWYKATPKNIARVEKEITKCNLVCSNCHRVQTYITRKQDAEPQG
jgi:hypothetical protein